MDGEDKAERGRGTSLGPLRKEAAVLRFQPSCVGFQYPLASASLSWVKGAKGLKRATGLWEPLPGDRKAAQQQAGLCV
jgi:hypothetical protein